ncbi:hypothetical protein ABTM69_20465, partial [Acinetobacter baumannii]
HDHLYARQQKDGVAYIETPQPSFGRHEGRSSAEEYGYREGVVLSSPGYLRVNVKPTGTRLEYLKTNLTDSTSTVVDQVELPLR